MGEILIDEPDLIIDDPAGDCVDYWTALIKEDKNNNNILQTEDTVQVDLFEKNTGHKKLPKEKKSDLRKKIKKILENATFPPEQIRKAIEGYIQDPSLMDMSVDQVDPSNIFLFDVCSENFLTASEYERKGMLQPIEDAEFDWKTFQDCRELNLLSKHQDDFEPGELEDEVAPKRKSCRIERYESPERPKGRNREERPEQKRRDSTPPKYRDRRQDEQVKENDREKDRDRERRSPPEKKMLVKLKYQRDGSREREDILRKEKLRQREKNQRRRSSSDRDKKSDSRDKERDRSRDREKIGRKRSSSKERNQEKRRENDASRRQTFRKEQEPAIRNERYDVRGSQASRPYNDNRENGNYKNGYQSRMNKTAIIEVDEKEFRNKNYRNYRDDSRTNKVMIIDDEDPHEPRKSSRYGGDSYHDKPRQFDPDRRNNYQQENLFNSRQFQAKANEMGQFFMQMMTQMMVNQFSSNPNMANMMEQFMNGINNENRSNFPNNRYHYQRPRFNNNNKRYSNNYNNDRDGFQKKPFYSRDHENDSSRRRRSNSDERNMEKGDWKARNDSRGKESQRSRYDNDDKGINEVTKRRNY